MKSQCEFSNFFIHKLVFKPFLFIIKYFVSFVICYYLLIIMPFSLLVQRKGQKERTPHEKLFSSFASFFSGIAELTGLRSAQTCCNSFPKNHCSLRAFQGVIDTYPELLTKVILTDKTNGKLVFAYAVKWVKKD